MFALVIIRKDILKTLFSLILANKKLFAKNPTLPSLFNIEKVEITIPKVFKVILLIF